MPKTNRIFSDLDPNFISHPMTKQVVKQYDAKSIGFSVKNLVLTNFYDVPFQPNKGSSVRALLFENMSPIVEDSLERAIRLVISKYEPRVAILGVSVDPNYSQNLYNISIRYTILNQTTPYTVDFVLERVR